MRVATCAVLATITFAACVPGGDGSETPQPPRAELRSVTLAAHPPAEKLAYYYCDDLSGSSLCGFFFDGDPPPKSTLTFSFDIAFDMGNPNGFPVPMVELLLALGVFQGADAAELGAICVSFCDPEQEDCAEKDPTEACKAPDKEIKSLEDFVPTVEDLVRIAKNAATDALDDNLKFRLIPARSEKRCHEDAEACEACDVEGAEGICCGEEEPAALDTGCHFGVGEDGRSCEICDGQVEAHVRFDLGVDPILAILEKVAEDSLDDLVTGEVPSFDIPYNVQGSLFFDVPVLGRFALGFGPVDDVWKLDPEPEE